MTDRDEHLPTSGASRRALLLGAGAVGAMGVLAGCGTDAPTTGPTGGNLPPPPSAPDGPKPAIKAADVPVGGGKIYTEQSVVVTQPVKGTYRAFDATCQHQGCLVNAVANGKIVCPCHGSEYNIADGTVAKGPATKGLPVKRVEVSGEALVIT